MVLEVTPEHRLARIVLEDVDGASTEYRFPIRKKMSRLRIRVLRFKPPAGTEIAEGALGAVACRASERAQADSSLRRKMTGSHFEYIVLWLLAYLGFGMRGSGFGWLRIGS